MMCDEIPGRVGEVGWRKYLNDRFLANEESKAQPAEWRGKIAFWSARESIDPSSLG